MKKYIIKILLLITPLLHIHRYKKVVLMEGAYLGILLYDELQDRYYDFTLREVKLK